LAKVNFCRKKKFETAMLTIRKATVEDADSIRKLFRETIISVNKKDYDEEQISIWASGSENKNGWEKKITEQNFLVAEIGSKTVGFSSITDEGYIDFMFTHKDHQHQGIATKMLSRLEEIATEKKLGKVWAEVSITARQFFSGKGFIITERFVKEVSGVKFDDCIMTKYFEQHINEYSMEKIFEVRLIAHGSSDYNAELELRNKILRIPLGLDVYEDDLSNELNHFHMGAFDNNKLVGVLVLTPLSKSDVKMRQVAVEEELQGKGIGKKLVEFSEQFSKEKGFRTIVMNARDTAVPFYEKLGYSKEGDMFTEVTIPHFKLYKNLYGD
jgi:ribosomal protein S18 acetylase RimI-like enzyme